jgi:two-component sensor histidine kinase
LKRLEDRQTVLVAELQHRTRNLIGVVRAISEQTLANTGSGAEFQAAFSQRLQALARVQGVLSRAEQEPVTLNSLLDLELEALAAPEQRSRITLNGPQIALPKSVVQTLSMALHELATNATKYGALVADGGRLEVNWRETRSAAGRRLFLEWIEDGLDLERELQGPMTKGFGRKLIEEALPYSHGARTRFELSRSGARCTIDLPLH